MKKLILKSTQLVAGLLHTLIIDPLETTLLHLLGPDLLPARLQIRRALLLINNIAWLFVSRFRINAVQWHGKEWTVLFFHDGTGQSKEELKYWLFPEAPTEVDLGWTFLWKLPSIVDQHIRQDILVICELNRLVKIGEKYRYHITTPPWLRAFLDLTAGGSEILNRISKTRRQQIKTLANRGFSYTFSQDPADFEMFYYDMYVPHVTRRHDERAIVEPMETKRAVFEKGGLVVVRHNGKPVGAGLRHIIGNTLVAASYGIHKDCRVKGVSVALHWYTIEWGQQNRLSHVDLGMTRPRLKDGVFEYKRQWGAQFEDNILDHLRWTLVGDRLPAPLLAHLNQLGLIAEVGNQFRCVLFRDELEDNIDQDLLYEMEQKSIRAGLGPLLFSPTASSGSRSS
jgi:hypothetical protein